MHGQPSGQSARAKSHIPEEPPFSRTSFGVGGSPLGIRMMAATIMNPYLNVRIEGAILKYTLSNLLVGGYNVDTHLNLASAGESR